MTLTEDPLPGLDAVVRGIMRDWHVPGLALAVVSNGQVLTARGYGHADVGRKLPVTPETAFAIGSCTKAFTTTALAMLVERGKLAWDRPVRDYLPEFRLFDEVAGARVTPRDLACHRTGVPRHDPVWYLADVSREELVRRLAHLPNSVDLRARYQYNNLMYITAGVLVEAVSGMRWETFVRRYLLEPLGMTRTSFSPARALALGNLARPHLLRKGRIEPIPFMAEGEDALSAAGWIHASVLDMTHWLRFQLAGGEAGGAGRLISQQALGETHTPQVVASEPFPMFTHFPEVGVPLYGLGWRIQTYRGHLAISHGGAIDGYCAQTSFLPRDGMGAVILTNLDDHSAAQIVLYAIYDRLLGLDAIDWNARIRQRTAALRELADAEAAQARTSRSAAGGPAVALEAFAGRYHHPGYGGLEVRADASGLTVKHNRLAYTATRLGALSVELTHPLVSEPRFARFLLDSSGNVDGVAIPFEPSVPEIVFARRR